MKINHFAVILLCLPSFASAADPTCSTGIIHPDSMIPACCDSICGDSCGTEECGNVSADNCCASTIITENKSCDTNDPPCVITSTDENASDSRTCSEIGGLLSTLDGVTCCLASCGYCGGFGCDKKPGGVQGCCMTFITPLNKSCDTNDPPCTVSQTSTVPVPIADTVDVKRNVAVGVYTSSQTPQNREQDLGIEIFDYQLVFQKIYSLDYPEIKSVSSDGYIPILNLEFLSDSSEPVLKKILSGTYDDQLEAFAKECADGGITFWIRTLHEFNGNWYPWGLLYTYNGETNSPADLKLAMQRVIKIFRDANAPVKFQLNINAENGYDDPRPFSYFWPGTEGLDAVTITSYNRAYSTIYHQFSNSFYEGFKPAYVQVLELTDLPIWVAETGTTSYGTDKPTWLRECFESIALDFPKVVQLTFFMDNKINEGTLTDWDLNTDADKEAFIDGFLNMKELTS